MGAGKIASQQSYQHGCCQVFLAIGKFWILQRFVIHLKKLKSAHILHLKTDNISSPNEQWALDAKSRSQLEKVATAWIWIALEDQKPLIFPSLWGLGGKLNLMNLIYSSRLNLTQNYWMPCTVIQGCCDTDRADYIRPLRPRMSGELSLWDQC